MSLGGRGGKGKATRGVEMRMRWVEAGRCEAVDKGGDVDGEVDVSVDVEAESSSYETE